MEGDEVAVVGEEGDRPNAASLGPSLHVARPFILILPCYELHIGISPRTIIQPKDFCVMGRCMVLLYFCSKAQHYVKAGGIVAEHFAQNLYATSSGDKLSIKALTAPFARG